MQVFSMSEKSPRTVMVIFIGTGVQWVGGMTACVLCTFAQQAKWMSTGFSPFLLLGDQDSSTAIGYVVCLN